MDAVFIGLSRTFYNIGHAYGFDTESLKLNKSCQTTIVRK